VRYELRSSAFSSAGALLADELAQAVVICFPGAPSLIQWQPHHLPIEFFDSYAERESDSVPVGALIRLRRTIQVRLLRFSHHVLHLRNEPHYC
jgi:hypothetical protein